MNMTSNSADQANRFTGKHMLMVMFSFFGVIIAVNFTMAYLASSSWTGLVVKNTYVASQQYNDHLEAAVIQKSLGVTSKLSYQRGQLFFSAQDREGNRVHVEEVLLEIGRPAYEQADKVLRFMPGPNSTNKVSIHLEPGVWALTIKGEVSGKAYRRDARLFVNEQGKGVIE